MIKGTCLIRGVITVQIKSRGRHPDHRIKNQGAQSERFYKAFHRIKSWPSITIRRSRLNRNGPMMDRFIVTVDQNDRTVTPKCPLNRLVLRRCMYSSWISIKLNCLDTIPLVSLDSILFLFHFRIHGGVEIKIWWRIEGEIAA